MMDINLFYITHSGFTLKFATLNKFSVALYEVALKHVAICSYVWPTVDVVLLVTQDDQ